MPAKAYTCSVKYLVLGTSSKNSDGAVACFSSLCVLYAQVLPLSALLTPWAILYIGRMPIRSTHSRQGAHTTTATAETCVSDLPSSNSRSSVPTSLQ